MPDELKPWADTFTRREVANAMIELLCNGKGSKTLYTKTANYLRDMMEDLIFDGELDEEIASAVANGQIDCPWCNGEGQLGGEDERLIACPHCPAGARFHARAVGFDDEADKASHRRVSSLMEHVKLQAKEGL